MIFTIYDLEATDKNPKTASPIEMAYINVNENLEVVESRDMYFSDATIPESKPEALALHGMSRASLLKYAPEFEANCRTMFRLFYRGNLVGFNNKAFDDHLCVYFLERQGYDEMRVDTTRDLMHLLRPVFGKAPKLADALAHFGITHEFIEMMTKIYFANDVERLRPHNAAYDATATLLLLAKCKQKNIITLQ